MNSFDQVSTQISQNVESTSTVANQPLNEANIPENMNTSQPDSQQSSQVKNFAQEEKDEELIKNISNYENLLE